MTCWTRHIICRNVLLLALLAFLLGCGIFEPREPEEPTQSGLNFIPPTDPEIVITNLQAAVDQKNIANYMSCFTDPQRQNHPFVFFPSAEGSAQYGAVLNNWSRLKEEEYFTNLIAQSPENAFSNLLLSLTSSVVTADSVVYEFDYSLTFQHADPGFPQTGRGRLQFTIGVDNSNFWTIHRWIDYKTTDDPTWSLFKGKFSN
jgi:hypothetical protein